MPLVSCAVDVDIDSMAVGFVINPVSFVDITINVGEFSKSLSSVIFPVSLVAGSIRPHLLAIAITESTNPLSSVGGPGLVPVGWSLLTFGIRIVLSII